MSRAMLQAGSYQGAVPTNIEKEAVTNPTLPYNFSSRPMIHYIRDFSNFSNNVIQECEN